MEKQANRRGVLWIGLLILFSCQVFDAQSQVREFDKLEMIYDQGHYRAVYRKAGRLLDNPEFDYSRIPSFYRSISLFQICQNEYWLKRHPNALEEAKALFVKIKSASDGRQVLEAHMFEVSALKRDMIAWTEDLKRAGKEKLFERVQGVLYDLFEGVPDIEHEGGMAREELKLGVTGEENSIKNVERKKMVSLAMKQLGVPYVWSGTEPTGFDCSGFTSYIHLQCTGAKIPRRAKDQYQNATKLKQKNVQPGDLVFFDNGSGISHVGMIVSKKGEPLAMIHASSTKGIVITNIEKSNYWQSRIYGFGTYVENK